MPVFARQSARAAKTVALHKKQRPKAIRASLPSGIEPMLAANSTLPTPAEDGKFAYEYKWDGVRAIGYWDGRKLKLESRNLLDITRRYPEIWPIGESLGRHRVALDGEIIALDEAGRPSFAQLQNRMHVERAADIQVLLRGTPVWWILFDILHLDGRDLTRLPYSERRKLLEQTVKPGPAWRLTPSHIGGGPEMLQAARDNELEGLVAKQLDSNYEPGRRSPAWRKIKIVRRQEFVIGGFTFQREDSSQTRLGSLLLGYHDDEGKLRFAGPVGSGFTARTHQDLLERLTKIRAPHSPFTDRIGKRDLQYVRPVLVAEVEYRRWPEGGLLQHVAYKGLRPDKVAKSVVKEGITGLDAPAA